MRANQPVTVKIPAGVDEGMRIRLKVGATPEKPAALQVTCSCR